MKKRKIPDLEKYLEGKKRRFVNYTQGAKIYRIGSKGKVPFWALFCVVV